MRNTPIPRRHDTDWLRFIALGMVFLFHCARFFDHEGWHVKNLESSDGLDLFVFLAGQWIMPLFFLLSGIGVWFSLTQRRPGTFIREKIFRLLVPLLFGILVLVPPQVYVERRTHGAFPGSFLAFFPHYFDGFYAFGGNFAWMGLHLWYLEILFIFSLLTIPLFRWLIRPTPQAWISRIAVLAQKPGAPFFVVLPLWGLEVLGFLQPDGIGRRDFGGWNLLVYLGIFILGYLLALDHRFQKAIERHRAPALALGIACMAVEILLLSGNSPPDPILFAALRVCTCWCWVLALLGFSGTYLSFENTFLRYATEAALPFYMLHQTVIVLLGFLLRPLALGVASKFTVLAGGAFLVSMAIYEGAIRRRAGLRVLFGMKSP